MTNYEVANEVARLNARKLAKHDAETTSIFQALTYLKDPSIMLDAYEVLLEWSNGSNTTLVFTGLDREIFKQLTVEDKRCAVFEWINHYLYYMSVFLTERVEGSK